MPNFRCNVFWIFSDWAAVKKIQKINLDRAFSQDLTENQFNFFQEKGNEKNMGIWIKFFMYVFIKKSNLPFFL